nr:hypothetical protein [Tanacetum cinerariifolium]
DIEKQAYNARLAKLQVRNIATLKLVDWSMMDEIGFHLELTKMFRIRFKEDDELLFTCRAWWKAFKVKEDVYKEWCLEFFSTLWVDEKIKVENITSEVCIWFRLCGRNYEFALLDFTVLLGLYTEDEINKPKFKARLEAGEMNFDKLLVNAVLHRDYSRDKLFHTDVWLMSLIPERHAANVPWIITTYLFDTTARKRGTSKIGGGHWVTRTVRNLGLFVPLEIKKCSPPLKSRHAANVPWIITTYLFDTAARKRGTSKIGGGHWVTRTVRNLGLFVPLEIKKCSPPLKSRWLDKKSFAGLIDKETNKLLLPDDDDDENEHEENASSGQNVRRVDTSIMGSMGHGNDDVGAKPSHVTKLVEYTDGIDKDNM